MTIPNNNPANGNPAQIAPANQVDHHIVMMDAQGQKVPLAVKFSGGQYILRVDSSGGAAPVAPPATEATQLAVKAAVDLVKVAVVAGANATTAEISAANAAIVAAIVAMGNGKATTADITALGNKLEAATLDQKAAIVAQFAPLMAVQTNTAATVGALATVNANLAGLLSATNTNDAAMLAAIIATRDNVASAHSDAQAQLAEEQTQTALMAINNAKLEAIRALQQAVRDVVAQIRDKLTDDPSTDATLKKLLLSQATLTEALLGLMDKEMPKPAVSAGFQFIASSTTAQFKAVRSLQIEALGADVTLLVRGKQQMLPKDRKAQWTFDEPSVGVIEVTTTASGTAIATFTD